MKGFERLGKLVETDVLVIGSGIAGAFAAIKARETGAVVTVVDRSYSGKSGASFITSGALHHFHPEEDNLDDALKEGVLSRVYLADQSISRKALLETYQRIDEMASWGVRFEMKGGRINRVKGHGSVASRAAILTGGGGQMMRALSNQMKRVGTRIIDRVMITDLLTSDGKHPTRGHVVGAIGFSPRTGDTFIFKSKSTILCTGCWKLPYAEHIPLYQGGDGHAMALRAGAELNGLDLSRIRGVRPVYATIGSTINIMMAQGAIMTNAQGERYMETLDPLRKEQTERWLLIAATFREIRENRGPIGVDMRHFTPEQFEFVRASIPSIINKIESAGKDIRKDKLEYTIWRYPMLQVGEGGAYVDEKGQTTIPGLFAAGDCSDNSRSFTGALIGAAVIGSWAGINAGRDALGKQEPVLIEDQVHRIKEVSLRPLRVKPGIPYSAAWEKAEYIAREGIGILKEAGRLEQSRSHIRKIREAVLPQLSACSLNELSKIHTLMNFLEVAEAVCIASTHRLETRGVYLREDFWETDNIHNLKWVLTSKRDGKISVRSVPLPTDSYPFPPPRVRFNQLYLFADVKTELDILNKAVSI